MTRALVALAAALSLLAGTPALAADNYAITSGGASKTVRAKDIGSGVLAPMSIAIDGSGVERFTASNPAFFSVTNWPSTWAVTAAQLPASLGAKTGALSLSIVPASDAGMATSANQASEIAAINAVTSAINAGAAAALPAGTNLIGGVDTVVRGTATDAGGTIATGGTAQTFVPANAARRSLSFQNQSSGDLYFACSGSAATMDYHALRVPAGAFFDTPPHHVGTLSCSMIGATTGQVFYARVN